MVTKVEAERSPRRLPSRRLLLVAAAVVAAFVFIIIGARAINGEAPPSPSPVESELPDSPQIADASFVLQNYGTLTPEESQFWQDLTLNDAVALGLPLCRYNRYYTRFFLKEGEVVELAVESNTPLGASLNGGFEGVSVMLMPSSAPYEQSQAQSYLPPTETEHGGYFTRLERNGGNWQVKWAISALGSDYYWLILTNTARQDAWCHLTVNVPPD